MSARNMWGAGCWAKYAQRTTKTSAESGRQRAPPNEPQGRQKQKLTGGWRRLNPRSEKRRTPLWLPLAVTGTGGNGGKDGVNNNQLAKTDDPWGEIRRLCGQLEKAKKPDPKDLERLRQLAVRTPGFLAANSMTQSIRHQLIEKISNGASRVLMLAEVVALKKELGFGTAPPLERLLIEQVATARLRLVHAEHTYNQCVVGQSIPLAVAVYRDNLLSSTQARFLRAIETLARVRRLARNTPALQINIANDGGKQVNVQGDVNKQGSIPAPATAPPVIA